MLCGHVVGMLHGSWIRLDWMDLEASLADFGSPRLYSRGREIKGKGRKARKLFEEGQAVLPSLSFHHHPDRSMIGNLSGLRVDDGQTVVAY